MNDIFGCSRLHPLMGSNDTRQGLLPLFGGGQRHSNLTYAVYKSLHLIQEYHLLVNIVDAAGEYVTPRSVRKKPAIVNEKSGICLSREIRIRRGLPITSIPCPVAFVYEDVGGELTARQPATIYD